MKRYVAKDLPGMVVEDVEILRFYISRDRRKAVWCAFKDSILARDRIVRNALCLIACFAAVVALFVGRLWESLSIFVGLLLYVGRFIWIFNRYFSFLQSQDCSPVLTKEGPQYIVNLNDGETYFRLESANWREVKSIRFYRDFLVIEMKKESQSGFFFMWTDEMEKIHPAVLSLWNQALYSTGEDHMQSGFYSEAEENEVSAFIDRTFGEYEFVFHEIASPDIHLDIAVIPPSEERNYYTLCTIGAGAHRMQIPENVRLQYLVAEYAELLIYLPADWDFSEDALNDARNYWPIRLLKDFARMPINTHSWMSWGHTLSSAGNAPFAAGVPYNSAILLYPQPDVKEEVSCPLSTMRSVNFYQVFPLSEEELGYMLQQTAQRKNIDLSVDAMLTHIHAQIEDWVTYALSRFSYRET